MTCREKLAIEHPDEINPDCYGGCKGCPSVYGYLQNPDYCDGGENYICTKCWDREIPETESTKPVTVETTSANTYHPEQLDLHKLIDEAMEKKDREVSIFIMKDNMSVYVRPVSSNDPRWIVHEKCSGRKITWEYECSECHVYSDKLMCYCGYCGEKLRMPVIEDKRVKGVSEDSVKEAVKEAKDDGESKDM